MSASAIASWSTAAAFGVARSFSGRKWILQRADEDTARELARTSGISFALARLLVGRGVNADALQDVLNPTLKRLMPDPFVLLNMDKTVARVRQAIETSEHISIFGDYDVDGSCSSALLHDFLAALDIKPRIYIPDRMTEGYGPSANAMRTLKDEGASLVITVDCGATAKDALSAARDMELDVVVLDHHAVEDLPPALAQVNPNQAGDASGLHLSLALPA